MKPVAGGLLALNFCMYVIVAAIGGWAIDNAIGRGFTIGAGLVLPAHFSPIPFPMGNGATGFFVIFAVIAGVVGAASAIAGLNHVRAWNSDSLSAAASSAVTAWALTLLAMGLAWKEIHLTLSLGACKNIKQATTIPQCCTTQCQRTDHEQPRWASLRTLSSCSICRPESILCGGDVVLINYSHQNLLRGGFTYRANSLLNQLCASFKPPLST